MKRVSILLAFVFMISILPTKSFATTWAYPFVVWNDYTYILSDEYFQDKNEIDREIGQVTKYSDMEQYGGNFSNAYREGTKYYSIKGISTDEAIAVQDSDQYRVAYRGSKYTYEDSFIYLGWVIGGIVLVLVLAFIINELESKIIKKSMRKGRQR